MMKKFISLMTAVAIIGSICAFGFTVSMAEDSYTMDFSEFISHTDTDGNILRSVPDLNWYGYDANSKTKNTFTLAADETAGGGYYIKNNNSKAAAVQAGVYYPATSVADCIVKTKVKFSSLGEGNAFYVIARSVGTESGSNKDSKDYYALKGTYSADGTKNSEKVIQLSIIKSVNGEETVLASANENITVTVGTSAGLWYDAALKVKGETISAYFGDDEKPVATANDSTFVSGGAGIGAVANSGRVWFDNLTIIPDAASETPGEQEDNTDYLINYNFNDSTVNIGENGYLTTDDKATYYFVKQGTKTEANPTHYRAEYDTRSGDDKCIKLVDDENDISAKGDQSRLVIPFTSQTSQMISEFEWKGKFISKNKVGHYLTSDGSIAVGLEMFKDETLTNNKKVFVLRKSNDKLPSAPTEDTYTYSSIEVKDDQWYRIHTEADLESATAEIKIYELSADGSAKLAGTISGPLAKTGETFTENPSDISSFVIDTQGSNSASALLREVFVDNFKLVNPNPSTEPSQSPEPSTEPNQSPKPSTEPEPEGISVSERTYTINDSPAGEGLQQGELKVIQKLANNSDKQADITCITALYKDGTLVNIGIETKALAAGAKDVIYTTAVTVPAAEDYSGYTVKTFIWDGLDKMCPIITVPALYPQTVQN